MALILEKEDFKYFTPKIKAVNSKNSKVFCLACSRKILFNEEYIWFRTTSRDIFNYFNLYSYAKHPYLRISLCMTCWLKKKLKLIRLASTGYKELKLNE